MKFIGFYDYTVILTYGNLISSLCGIFLAVRGKLVWAVLCLVLSGVFDMFDGTVARTKKNRTAQEKNFGIQLDSLCDLVSFGVLPALLSYQLGMDSWLGIGILVLFCLCGLIRLAYYNVLEIDRQQVEEGNNKTFHGLPITSTAIIFPLVSGLRAVVPENGFLVILHGAMLCTALLFVLDITIPKVDIGRLFAKMREQKAGK